MAKQYLCFYDTGLTGDEERDRSPVGYGATRIEAMTSGIRNAFPHLGAEGAERLRYSGFATVEQPDLAPADFAALAKIIDDFFAGKGGDNGNA